MPRFLRAHAITLLFVVGACPGAAWASSSDGESLGGGSDIRGGSVIELTSGASIGPSHYVFADNPGAEPIDVEFRGEAADGITITPEFTSATIDAGASTKDFFAIALNPALPPGDYPVTVQLIRADITSVPGELTNIPAVGTSFTLRVVGASATVAVEARSIESGLPVAGTLVLAATSGTEAAFEVARAEASELTATVAPGRYRASYVLDGRELAFAEADVPNGRSTTLQLQVNTVSFVIVDATPVTDGDKVVVAELVASVDNHLRVIEGDVTIRAHVYLAGQQIDTAVLEQTVQLPIGVTEAQLTYRPDSGFAPGNYRFEFELVTAEFTLMAPTQVSFTVDRPTSGDRSLPIAIAAAAVVVAAVAVASVLLIQRRRLRR